MTDAAATGPADVKRSVGLGPSSSGAPRPFGHARLPPMHLAVAKSVEDTCHGTGAVLGECILGVAVQSLTPQPPDAVVQMRLGGLRGAIGGRVPQGACVTGLTPFFLLGNF
ncbi:uncharacterized protein Tco025E_07694 [Trypanosoma conorhini]|uniref:Uncharacterized protein n=1 Tax=Trypanosoma conorhini TaxID=83891 RepID=A0A3S5IRD1_9TRYP|nr:uncharacterized protein Tco025E_07694 [Trypanosoma conorhini]RNF05968.1 hypothetical protein Tco025E_07694 [Trypanosoma conorhini]